MLKKTLIAALFIAGCHPVYAESSRQITINDRLSMDAEQICEMAGQGGNTSCTELLHDDYLRAIYKGVQLARSGTTVTSRDAIQEVAKARPCNTSTDVCIESTKHSAKWIVYGNVEYSHTPEIYEDLYEYFADDREFFY